MALFSLFSCAGCIQLRNLFSQHVGFAHSSRVVLTCRASLNSFPDVLTCQTSLSSLLDDFAAVLVDAVLRNYASDAGCRIDVAVPADDCSRVAD